MTDEEMAEEYANTVKCEWENDTYWVDCRDKVEDAFLAGLEAGRPKWHNVADGDLPNCVYGRTVLNQDGEKVMYDYYCKSWRYADTDKDFCDTPIAWCEIPIYTEE